MEGAVMPRYTPRICQLENGTFDYCAWDNLRHEMIAYIRFASLETALAWCDRVNR